MQISSENEVLKRISYLTGSAELVAGLADTPAKIPFDDEITGFLNEVSRVLMSDREAKAYSDVVTFAFWIRKSSVIKLKERFERKDEQIRLGRGAAFHIAPSNVPCNFAYSMVAGLLTGNANVVRIPTKDFPQVDILVRAFNQALDKYPDMKPYVILVRYGRDKEINDLLSSVADTRIIWGGDKTIADIRRSPLPPRSGEITFADRYSLAVIDSDSYLETADKKRTAEDFYNDTFFSDQNACTSPRIVVWTGSRISEAKELFWTAEHELAAEKYDFQPIQGVNKLTSGFLYAVRDPKCRIEPHDDNLIIRVTVTEISGDLMDYRDNSGYFYEYSCDDIMDIRPLCDDKRCQTVAYIGDPSVMLPLIRSGAKGIDRIVPMGKTMDFDLIWDGYDLPAMLTRTVVVA